ncbi:M48 family metalloprotease [bacterium]|nr:M48 family metalloprotease [bacterium]
MSIILLLSSTVRAELQLPEDLPGDVKDSIPVETTAVPQQEIPTQPPQDITLSVIDSDSDYKDVFKQPYQNALSLEEKAFLIDNLSIFAESRLASKVFQPQRILVTKRDKKYLIGQLYDFKLLENRELKAPVGEKESLKLLCDLAKSPRAFNSDPVVVNTESKKYHRPGANHLKRNDTIKHYPSAKAAQRDGYESCTLCFPQDSAYLSGNDYERKISEQATQAIQQRYRISQDEENIKKVQRVGANILKANGYAPNYCSFILLDSDEAQALSVRTGPIFITSGLLNLLETEDELAAVLSHEFAHIILNHSQKSGTRNTIGDILGATLRYSYKNYWGYFGSRQAINLINKGFSREQEYEADEYAVYLSMAADYSPLDFSNTLEKLEIYQRQTGKGTAITWFSTHPSSDQRIKRVKKLCQQLQNLDEASRYAQEHQDPQLAKKLRSQAKEYAKSSERVDTFFKIYKKLIEREDIPSTENSPSDYQLY